VDLSTLLGFVIGLGGILVGNAIEGGKLSQIMQGTAFMIVIGGTIGAIMIQHPMEIVKAAIGNLKLVFQPPHDPSQELIDEIVKYATIARKDGILALEPLAPKASDPFLARALMMAVDGADSKQMREVLEQMIHHVEQSGDDSGKFFEAAGGYAPTIGIIGAVLGLIQVMQNLTDIAKVGEGIATAFVATIYGVGFANIIFLPFGTKIKLRTREMVAVKTLILEGALSIQEGMNPKIVKDRLASFAPGHHGEGHGKEGAA
jgi:chemotaxis protein MotA